MNNENNKLPPVTPEYWEAEFEGAFAKGEWDEEGYNAWNKHLNDLALEGEILLCSR